MAICVRFWLEVLVFELFLFGFFPGCESPQTLQTLPARVCAGLQTAEQFLRSGGTLKVRSFFVSRATKSYETRNPIGFLREASRKTERTGVFGEFWFFSVVLNFVKPEI